MSDVTLLRQALVHLEPGDWEEAHNIVQGDDRAAACWLHGIVHVMEGDLDNARYWYGRVSRMFSRDAMAEIAEAKKTLA